MSSPTLPPDPLPGALPDGSADALIDADALTFAHPGCPVFSGLTFRLRPGLTLLRGGEGRGKTSLLRLLAGELEPTAGRLRRRLPQPTASVWYAQPQDEAHDEVPAEAWLAERRARFPRWRDDVAQALIEAFGLGEHLGKRLLMLSTGSRRKVGLVGAAASGAALTLLDQPWAALDARSGRVLSELLTDAAEDRQRAWVVADYEPPAELAEVDWAGVIDLGD
jgi:ABC-type multidrug transport system ATPase subunit